MIFQFRQTWLAYLMLTLFAAVDANLSVAEDQERSEIINQLRQMSEAELKSYFQELQDGDRLRWTSQLDLCLSEMIRRGADWSPYLKTKFDELNRSAGDKEYSEHRNNLKLLTAIRRAEGQPDPVVVEIESFDRERLTCMSLPRIHVALKNVAEQPVNIAVGGNYRSGRLTRWRALLTNEKGETVPVRPWLLAMGGGLMSWRDIPPGESVKTELLLQHMVDVMPPGKYQFQIVYSDSATILLQDSLEGLILCKSEPMEIEIHPLEINVGEESISDVESWTEQLDEEVPIRIMTGKYGQWAEDFIAHDETVGPFAQPGLAGRPDTD